MKKRRISISYQDGEDHLENGNDVDNNGHGSRNMGQYAIIELEIDQCLKDEKTELFRKTLQKVHSKFVEEDQETYKPKIRQISYRRYAYAIAVTLALIIGIFGVFRMISGTSKSNFQYIFAQYYKPYQNEFITRSDQVTVNNLYSAFQAYENRDYERAVALFNKAIEADKSLLLAYFYKGVSCIEISDYKTAIESLGKVLTNETNPYFSQAKWYTALTLLKLNKPELARPHLEWLALNDRYYGIKAKEILKKFNK